MRKARGCFITFLIVVLIISIVIFFYIGKNNKVAFTEQDINENESSQTSLDESNEEFVNYNDNSIDYLFLGIDEREDQNKFEGRTDTIIIYHLGKNKKDALISIPRDTKVELKDHGTNKINAAYEFGGDQMIKEEIYKLTDIKVDKIMLVNFNGFIKIIDALGGVKITVDEPLHDPKSGSNFDPGTYNFNGEQALAFSRCRSTSKGDFDRMDRQKYLLSQLFEQKVNISIVPKIPSILKILNTETKSDFTVFDYTRLGFRLLVNKDNLKLLTLPGKTKTINGISYVIINEKEAKEYLKENLN